MTVIWNKSECIYQNPLWMCSRVSFWFTEQITCNVLGFLRVRCPRNWGLKLEYEALQLTQLNLKKIKRWWNWIKSKEASERGKLMLYFYRSHDFEYFLKFLVEKITNIKNIPENCKLISTKKDTNEIKFHQLIFKIKKILCFEILTMCFNIFKFSEKIVFCQRMYLYLY